MRCTYSIGGGILVKHALLQGSRAVTPNTRSNTCSNYRALKAESLEKDHVNSEGELVQSFSGSIVGSRFYPVMNPYHSINGHEGLS